jgi:hypothetical protein
MLDFLELISWFLKLIEDVSLMDGPMRVTILVAFGDY